MDKVLKTSKNPADRFPGPGPGRPKGLQNKTTTLIKESFTEAFFKTGGTAGLIAWIEKSPHNRGQFYTMIMKLIPTAVEVDANIKGNVTFIMPRPGQKNK